MAPRYEIRTVHDFAKVPEASRDVCLREFLHWLAMMDHLTATMPVGRPEAFVWIDDGKHEATVSVTDSEQTIHVVSGRMRGFERWR